MGVGLEITREESADYWEVEALFDLCFAPGREALASYRLRDNRAPINELCLIARNTYNNIAGAIRYWPILINACHVEAPALLLGPIAVHPTHQGEGLAAQLIEQSLSYAKELGWTRVVLVGDLPYYRRFGFKQVASIKMPAPTNPERVLGLDLQEGAWDGLAGTVVCSKNFNG